MNSVSITGRLTKDIELKSTQSSLSVCTFTVAVQRPHTKETTDFIPCVAWRQSAEFLAKYARKGSRVGVTGTLTSRVYDDGKSKRTFYEVSIDTVELLESRAESQGDKYTNGAIKTQHTQSSPEFEREIADMQDLSDDDLPF